MYKTRQKFLGTILTGNIEKKGLANVDGWMAGFKVVFNIGSSLHS